MYVVHIAIYCNILIYRNILPIYCNILYIATIYCILQQYIVYCNNISYIATIYRILQYIVIICDWGWRQSMKMDGFEKLEIDPKSKKFYKKKKIFAIYAIYCSRSLARQYILQYSPQTPVYIAIFASGSNILQYCVYCNILPIYCSRNIRLELWRL